MLFRSLPREPIALGDTVVCLWGIYANSKLEVTTVQLRIGVVYVRPESSTRSFAIALSDVYHDQDYLMAYYIVERRKQLIHMLLP